MLDPKFSHYRMFALLVVTAGLWGCADQSNDAGASAKRVLRPVVSAEKAAELQKALELRKLTQQKAANAANSSNEAANSTNATDANEGQEIKDESQLKFVATKTDLSDGEKTDLRNEFFDQGCKAKGSLDSKAQFDPLTKNDQTSSFVFFLQNKDLKIKGRRTERVLSASADEIKISSEVFVSGKADPKISELSLKPDQKQDSRADKNVTDFKYCKLQEGVSSEAFALIEAGQFIFSQNDKRPAIKMQRITEGTLVCDDSKNTEAVAEASSAQITGKWVETLVYLREGLRIGFDQCGQVLVKSEKAFWQKPVDDKSKPVLLYQEVEVNNKFPSRNTTITK